MRTMAGHNKWSKIRHKKAANDKARAAAHTRATRSIESASRSCQGDLEDLHLQSALSAARAVQLPKERLERAIERGANPNSKSEEAKLMRYDGMIPAGESGKVAVIIEALTENRNRTAANVRHLVTKIGGELLPTGANDWLFEHVGLIWVSNNIISAANNDESDDTTTTTSVDIDALLECALEAGATDVDFDSLEGDDGSNHTDDEDTTNSAHNQIIVKCEPSSVLNIVRSLKSEGYITYQFENQWLIKDEDNRATLDEEGMAKFDKFMDTMEEDLDVINVFHNALVSEQE